MTLPIKNFSGSKLYTWLIAGLFVGTAMASWAAPKPPPGPAPAVEVASEKGTAGPTGLVGRFKPRAGLFYQPGFPLGTASDFLGAGFASFQAFGDVLLGDELFFWSPIKPGDFALELRAGLQTGYSYYGSADNSDNSDINASRTGGISQWQTLLNVTVAWKGLPRLGGVGLRLAPYSRIGFGTTLMSSYIEDGNGNVLVDESSLDGTFQFALGAASEIDSVQNVVFMYELSYLHVFESQDGSFIHMALGAGYMF